MLALVGGDFRDQRHAPRHDLQQIAIERVDHRAQHRQRPSVGQVRVVVGFVGGVHRVAVQIIVQNAIRKSSPWSALRES